MAEPGDPNSPQTPDPKPYQDVHHDDDLIGFASPAALQGRSRPPASPVERTPEPASASDPIDSALTPIPTPPSAPEPIPAWARETPLADQPVGSFARRREQPSGIDGAMSLYAVYALILFAVPTFGVSAVIALIAVTGRAGPRGEVAASHFIFQQRTLWAGAVVALLGGVLIAVGLGVFVLFVLAVWLILRGAGGVLKLKAGHPIARPRSWLF